MIIFLIIRRNPYFSGFSLAIRKQIIEKENKERRNPYFSGFSLAIRWNDYSCKVKDNRRNPYFSGFSLAIGIEKHSFKELKVSRNPYFSGFSLAIYNIVNNSQTIDTSQSLF